MGPIERELRDFCARRVLRPGWHARISHATYWFLRGAAVSLGLRGALLQLEEKGLLRDVLSEAIEAAEELEL